MSDAGKILGVDEWLDLLDAKGEREALRAMGLDVWDKGDGERVCGGVDGLVLVEVQRQEGWPLTFYIMGRTFSARGFVVALSKLAARMREKR